MCVLEPDPPSDESELDLPEGQGHVPPAEPTSAYRKDLAADGGNVQVHSEAENRYAPE